MVKVVSKPATVALFRLGRGISSCLTTLSSTLEAGVESGDFTVEDPTLLANTQVFFMVAAGVLFFGERLHARFALGVVWRMFG